MSEPAVPKPPAGGNGRLLPPDAGRDRPLFLVAAILVFLMISQTQRQLPLTNE